MNKRSAANGRRLPMRLRANEDLGTHGSTSLLGPAFWGSELHSILEKRDGTTIESTRLERPLATLDTPLSLQLMYLVLFPEFPRRCDPHQHRSNATFIIFGDSNRALAATKPDSKPRRGKFHNEPSSG